MFIAKIQYNFRLLEYCRNNGAYRGVEFGEDGTAGQEWEEIITKFSNLGLDTEIGTVQPQLSGPLLTGSLIIQTCLMSFFFFPNLEIAYTITSIVWLDFFKIIFFSFSHRN